MLHRWGHRRRGQRGHWVWRRVGESLSWSRRRRFRRTVMVGQRGGQRGERRWVEAVQMMGRMGLLMLLHLLLMVMVSWGGSVRRQRRRAFLVAGRGRISSGSGTFRPIAAAIRHVDPDAVVVLDMLQQNPSAAETSLACGADVRCRFYKNKAKRLLDWNEISIESKFNYKY